MGLRRVVLGSWIVAAVTACGAPPRVVAPPVAAAPKQSMLAVLPAESDAFPNVARSATASMSHASVPGIDATQISKVSLEVVQLSIECVDPTVACYQAVGHSLAANKLLFAQIVAGSKHGQVKVTITLFDVDSNNANSGAEVYASEDQASAAIAELVTKATHP